MTTSTGGYVVSRTKGRAPPNHRLGRARSLARRKADAASHHAFVWEWLVTLARWEQPKSNRAFADLLNDARVPSARGGRWTAGLVHAQLKKRDTTAKRLVQRMTEPNIYERRDFPIELYQQWRQALDRVDAPYGGAGRWQSVLYVEPQRADLVRHTDWGEGQIIEKVSPSVFTCRFLGEGGTFDVQCGAVELDVFVFRRSRAERIAETSRLSRRFFGRT